MQAYSRIAPSRQSLTLGPGGRDRRDFADWGTTPTAAAAGAVIEEVCPP